MNKILLDKYTDLLLKCLKLDTKKYLFVSVPNFLKEFKESLDNNLKKYDLEEVYYDLVDPYKKHELLSYLDIENIYKHPMFDDSIYNKYAKLDAAFLFIRSDIPGLMEDIDPDKLKNAKLFTMKTSKYFRDLYVNDKLNWCIAGVPNDKWALEALKMSTDELWNYIFKICLVDEVSDPYTNWLNKSKNIKKYSDILNEYHFNKLHYVNSLGTDLYLELPNTHVWMGGCDNRGVFNNLPTEEVFTSPRYDKTEGIVYASKPLIYENVVIENFWIKFHEGKVIDYNAEVGYETLKSIIETDNYSSYLGECALVNYDSPINDTGVIFHETLYDENASCHLALGMGFTECLEGNVECRGKELRALGVNDSKAHVDFMIGTRDLKITGITSDGEEVLIMENGNICF